VLLIVLAGVGSAVAFSLATQRRYQATATFPLSNTTPDANIKTTLTRRLTTLEVRLKGLKQADTKLSVEATPGDPKVTLVADSNAAAPSVALVNTYAVQMLAVERHVNPIKLARQLADVQRKLAGTTDKDNASKRQRRRLRSQIDRLRAQAITDASFTAAKRAPLAKGPRPVLNGLLALPVSLLLAALVIVTLRRLDRHDGI
jgi:hypothetical protein